MEKNQIINFGELLKNTANLPLVRIDREKFLQSVLSKHYDEETVKTAIEHNPAYAGITVDEINKLAKETIMFETAKVSAISFAAGIPGGLAMIGTIPADLAQYFAHMLRVLHKLVYLYGWQQLYDDKSEDDSEISEIDDKTATLLTLFTGVMFGVSGAANVITKLSLSAAEHAGKVIARKALTKVALYRIVKKIATALGVRMTKEIFAKGVSKVIPIIGGVASGSLTFATYKPMAERLRRHLATLTFADVEYYKNNGYKDISIDDIIDVTASVDDVSDESIEKEFNEEFEKEFIEDEQGESGAEN